MYLDAILKRAALALTFQPQISKEENNQIQKVVW